MKKKALSLLLATTMVAALLTGCGDSNSTQGSSSSTESKESAAKDSSSTSTDNSSTAEAVTLKWAIWDQETTQYWKDIKEAYEASHEGVTVEMVDLGSTDYMTVLATDLSGTGSDFDVVTDQGCTRICNSGSEECNPCAG